MKIYDYRQELIDLLNNTSADPASLTQTLRSLTTIIHVLNHYAEAPVSPAVSGQPRQPKPRFHQHQVHPANQPLPENSKRQLKSLLTGPATDTQEENQRPAVSQAQTAAAPQEITPEERLAADNRYIVHRKLSGAEINHH